MLTAAHLRLEERLGEVRFAVAEGSYGAPGRDEAFPNGVDSDGDGEIASTNAIAAVDEDVPRESLKLIRFGWRQLAMKIAGMKKPEVQRCIL